MINTLLAITQDELPLAAALFLALIIISILLIIATVISGVLRLIIFFNYWVTDRERTAAGYTGGTAAQTMLSRLGCGDVAVQKAGFFRALIYGNHYNPVKKTIYLRASTLNRDNITSVGLALQKVALAVQDKKTGVIRSRWRLQQIGIFGPILFVPIVLVGAIVDLALAFTTGGDFSGIGTLISTFAGLGYFIISFVLTIMTIVVEKRANNAALQLIDQQGFLTDYEKQKVHKVFQIYILAYIADFIISLLELIKLIVKIALIFLSASGNKK